MKPNDIAIWERFLTDYPNAYDKVLYDVALGAARSAAGPLEPNIRKDWTLLTQKKIDVVGFRGNEIHIIEVKPNAGASALGQVLQYVALYRNYIDPDSRPVPILLSDSFSPDMPMLAQSVGVTLIKV